MCTRRGGVVKESVLVAGGVGYGVRGYNMWIMDANERDVTTVATSALLRKLLTGICLVDWQVGD